MGIINLQRKGNWWGKINVWKDKKRQEGKEKCKANESKKGRVWHKGSRRQVKS